MIMAEYALLIDGTFQEIRVYSAKPEDIPHKQATWYDVVREYGVPFEGLENNVWIIRTVDPATLPPPVPESISRRQCALQLLAMSVITAQEALDMTKTAAVPVTIASIFDAQVTNGTWTTEQRILAEIDFAATNYYRSNSLLPLMGLSEQEIDGFFIATSLL
jgi:hypothetical protein